MSDELQPGLDRPLRILLVDDESVERAAVLQALHQGGLIAEVVEAHDVESAQAALSASAYDCLVIDQALPGGDGLEVLERASRLGVVAPAIMLTASSDEPLIGKRAGSRAANYLPKSQASPERLVHSITHVLRADALQRRESEARQTLARHTSRLQALVEASMRIHVGPSVDEVLSATAAEALALFQAREARVEINARLGRDTIEHVATDDRAAASTDDEEVAVQDLYDAKRQRLGALTLIGAVLRDTDSVLLAQLARTAVGALENAWLLREATEAAQARDDVLAVVGHDLRGPLNMVSMGAAMLRKSLEVKGPEFAGDLEIVQRIDRGCKRMGRLIEDMLDAARLDEGTFAVTLRAVHVTGLMANAVDALALVATSAKVSLRLGAVEALRVLGDRDRLLQVFSNLVGNALKYTPRGGEIVLSVERENNIAVFTVVDSGSGVPPEYLPHLFDRYWKGTSGDSAALGLGLYISRGIVEAHHGRISVGADTGPGCTFVFTIPLAP